MSAFNDTIMRHSKLLLFVIPMVLLFSCVKAGKEVAEELGIVPSTCGSDGARVQVDVDGSAFCADAHITAVSDGTSAIVTGVGILGNDGTEISGNSGILKSFFFPADWSAISFSDSPS